MRYLHILLTLSLGLAACAIERAAFFHHGVEKTYDEYTRAVAACEKQVGGMDYPNAIAVCLEDAGWTSRLVYD